MGRETRSTYIERIFENINATSLEEVFEQEAENINIVIEDIQNYIEELKTSAKAEEFEGTPGEIEDAIFRRAFLDCVEVIEDKALNFLVTAAVKAVVATQEFNYDLYIEQLLSAMEANKETLIGIIPYVRKKAIEVKVGLNSLGKPEEWGKAIKDYRGQRSLGKITKLNVDIGSKIWKEKIYGVGREGGQVKRSYKETGSKDVNSKYKDLYRDTIIGRLANVPSDKAPFWYLIEHGNAEKGKKLKLDTDGVPYPVFGATNFVRNTEEAVTSAFLQIWTKYEEEARRIYEELEDKRVTELREKATKILEEEEKVAERKLFYKMKIDEGELEAYNNSKGVTIRLRDPKSGRYAPVPMGR